MVPRILAVEPEKSYLEILNDSPGGGRCSKAYYDDHFKKWVLATKGLHHLPQKRRALLIADGGMNNQVCQINYSSYHCMLIHIAFWIMAT